MDNNRGMNRLLILLPAAVSLVILSGCGSSKQPGEITEIPTTAAPLMDKPELELFETAKRYYRNGAYQVALDAFQSIRDGYPTGPYARFAEIKIGDCLFLQRNYLEAIAAYEEALFSRPGSEETAYLLLQLGRSNHYLNTDIGRDRGPLEKALEYYSRILNEYNSSPYAHQADKYRASVLADLAEHEKLVANFYKRQNREDAYRVRTARHQETLDEKSKVARAVRERPMLLSSATELKPITAPGPIESAQVRTGGTTTEGISSSLVRQIECKRRTPAVVELSLSRALTETPRIIGQEDGTVTIDLMDQFSDTSVTINCFGSRDLEIDGKTLTLQTTSNVRLVNTSYPARLMLFLVDAG